MNALGARQLVQHINSSSGSGGAGVGGTLQFHNLDILEIEQHARNQARRQADANAVFNSQRQNQAETVDIFGDHDLNDFEDIIHDAVEHDHKPEAADKYDIQPAVQLHSEQVPQQLQLAHARAEITQ